jgi:hypothetical protein
MGQRRFALASILSVLLLTSAAIPGLAQSQQPQRSQPLPAPQQQATAPKPYKAVAVTPAAPVSDPSFEPFRKQLADIVQKKDRKALAPLVANNFFWMGEKGDKAAKGRPGIENLAKAIELDARDGSGWETLEGFAADPSASPFPERQNTICAPAEPQFNEQEFEQLVEASGTSDEDWAVPTQAGLEMRAGPQPNAPVAEKLGMHFVRVLDDDNVPANQDSPMLRVVAPSGKVGFLPIDALTPLINDQLCYVKQGGAWKIAGFIGGDE